MARYNQKKVSKEVLENLYHEQGMTQAQVAEVLRVGKRSVRRWMAQYGIKARPFTGKYNPNYKNGLTCGMWEYNKLVDKIECKGCNAVQNLCVHHINFDHYDNHPDNLQVLCVSCHMSLHKQAYWDAIKAGREPLRSNGPIGWNK